ncbi:hypothetical protein RM844_20960 [Streptomyces sp. DSM 44915]|uniref:Uncharacterized protein n=1 Tax=Streptomyces chisholmiae TaxID=3075540 RepID=A0ABU2JVH0_9ACTN|nr:hypothetical protein [Streptomyces sp. DSM 44915]MDT0268761.1 hypothetical protein [Streptomyces sp. DSM 44915]
MTNTYQYRFRAPGGRGGLAADLVATAGPPPTTVGRGVLRLHRGVLLALPAAVYWRDAAWLGFGAALSAPALAATHPAGLLLDVRALDYPPDHYRAEVAALAVDGWLHREFDLPPTGAGVRPAVDGFAFSWGEHTAPFADPPPPR